MEQLSNEKVKIANQSYETIDAYVVQVCAQQSLQKRLSESADGVNV